MEIFELGEGKVIIGIGQMDDLRGICFDHSETVMPIGELVSGDIPLSDRATVVVFTDEKAVDRLIEDLQTLKRMYF